MLDFTYENIQGHKFLLLVHGKDKNFFISITGNDIVTYKTEPKLDFVVLSKRWTNIFAPKIKWSTFFLNKNFPNENDYNNYIELGYKVSAHLNNLKPIFNFILDKTLFHICVNYINESKHLFPKKYIKCLPQDIRKLIY